MRGFDQRNTYMNQLSPSQIRASYPAKRVSYLLGANDTAIDGNLDTSCKAKVQGAHRRERGENFDAYIDAFYTPNDHDKVVAYHRWDQGGPGDDCIVLLNFANQGWSNYTIGFPRAARPPCGMSYTLSQYTRPASVKKRT